MKHLLSLGAINKLTGEYVYPKIANKKDEYICPECNKDLILCQGEIRVHHFRHKVDSINPCHHYSNPTETQIHKDAKILLKNLFERKMPISFLRNCCCCKKNEEFEIPEITETSVIQLEYRFDYNGVKIADVAYIDDNEILCIFEICNTHKTCSENRLEPWFEIDAETLIKMANDNRLTSLQIPCIRCEKCDDCIKTEKKRLKKIKDNIKKDKIKKDRSDCLMCRGSGISYWSDDVYGSCFDCCCINCGNFDDECECEKSEKSEKSDDSIGCLGSDEDNDMSCLHDQDLQKIEEINKAIEECKRSFVEVDMDWMYEDNKSQKNRLQSLYTRRNFVENNIKYDECGCHTYKIIHPLSKQIVKLTSKNKLFVNGKWINVDFSDVIKWYNNDTNNIIDKLNKKQEIINNGDTLKYALTAKNKTERKKIMSKYLQNNNIGEINELDEHYFTQLYHKFYSSYDNRCKFKIEDIQNVTIERGDYNSKCFNLLVDNNKHIISIKRFN